MTEPKYPPWTFPVSIPLAEKTLAVRLGEAVVATGVFEGFGASFVMPGRPFVAPAFKYGPFRNRPKRAVPSAQGRQRAARKIERHHRK